CCARCLKHWLKVRWPLKLHTITDTRGQARSWGKGTCSKACRTADKAGLGRRSRVVNPKSQSSMSYPPRYHSSVQENAKTPAHPKAKAVRICQSRVQACASKLYLRLSSPISAITRGLSPAIF